LQKTENLILELFCRKKTILIWKFTESKKLGLNVCKKQKLGLETCFHDLMMEVEKPWGVCWGCSAQLLQCGGISLSLSNRAGV
jgi:hypothetical protein